MNLDLAQKVVDWWASEGLTAIRFSGGEPTLYKGLDFLVQRAAYKGIKRIAISTNGSAHQSVYQDLLDCGVNDFSVSLDACCAEDGDKMAGGVKGAWNRVVENIKFLSSKTYVTVGVVLTEANIGTLENTIRFADSLGVSDIRIIPAAQSGSTLPKLNIAQDLLDKYPILKHRWDGINNNIPIRGKSETDTRRCGLVLDDMVINHNYHYPCIIYMREGGAPIGEVQGKEIRSDRLKWYKNHDTTQDPICKKNCLDFCNMYNNYFEEFHK